MEEVEIYINKFRSIQDSILQYIDEEHDVEEKWSNLISLIDMYQIKNNHHEVEEILRLINKIAKNHYHSHNFYSKIEKNNINI